LSFLQASWVKKELLMQQLQGFVVGFLRPFSMSSAEVAVCQSHLSTVSLSDTIATQLPPVLGLPVLSGSMPPSWLATAKIRSALYTTLHN
jgi:hypothetical protein